MLIADWEYTCTHEHLQHAVEKGEHRCDGTHRLAEPVSNTTLNIWAGKPMWISPKYCVYGNKQITKPANSYAVVIVLEYFVITQAPL